MTGTSASGPGAPHSYGALGGDIQISYGLREILARMEQAQTRGFADLGARLDTKADKADLVLVHQGLGSLGERVEALERLRYEDTAAARALVQETQGRWTWREKVAAAIGTAALIAATLLGPALAHVLH